MEQLLHYVWKHKIFPLSLLQTTSGRPVEVIDPGLPNMNAGPDFFNAKLKIDGTLWAAADTAFHRRNHAVLHSDIKISFPCRRIIDHIPVFDQ